ncbi:hypothetical protein TWF718_008216 [Orbilia javanica]|uniref:Uncharacterized protein n=1 Tax=Orbilia javanica TaxID=47235 RepID=A0AAN8NTV1_9PEZI
MSDQAHENFLDVGMNCSGDIHNEPAPSDSNSDGIILDLGNHHEWSVSMRGLLEDKGWDKFLETPWHDGMEGDTDIWLAYEVPAMVVYNPFTGELEPLHPCSEDKMSEALSRRQCTAYILGHVKDTLRSSIDTRQEDPYTVWRGIEEFWNLKDFEDQIIRRWCRETLENMFLGNEQSIEDYIENAMKQYVDLHKFGGSMSSQEFIDCVTEGLWVDYICVTEKWNTEWLRMQGLVPTGVDRPFEERLRELKEQLEAREKVLLQEKVERDRIWLLEWEREKAEREAAKTPDGSSSGWSFDGDSPSISIYFDSP